MMASAQQSDFLKSAKYKVFVDLDGVLVDFDAGVEALFGRKPDDLPPPVLWSRLAKTPGFYDTLEWMADGRTLWDFVKQFEPTILTGLPRGAWAEPQKRAWCARELGEAVPVITCLSKEKADKAKASVAEGIVPILIDDRESLRESFEAAGGIFVFHTRAEESIAALRKLFS